MTTERWLELMNPTSGAVLTQQEIDDGWHFCPELDECLHGPQPGGSTECWCGHKMKPMPAADVKLDPF